MIRRLGHSSSRNIVSRNTVILAGIAAFTVLAVWIIATGKNTPATASLPSRFETKEQTDGNVTVTVTPQELTSGKSAMFQIVFDTHSVTLDFDVAEAAKLRDEKGNTYGRPAWSGDPPGGHHRKGTLSFSAPIGQTTSISLVLENIAGVKERTFEWNLQAGE